MHKMIAVMSAVAMLTFGLVLTAGPVAADGHAVPEGAQVTLRNTLQDPGEPETAFPALFGQPEDAFDENGTVSSSSSEFPTALAQPGTPAGDISGLYEIDISANSISFTMLPAADDPFWVNVFGEFPAGKFDRYYLTFSEPHNIAGATSSNSSVSLRVDSSTVVVVEIGEGYPMSPPLAFELTLESGRELAVTGADSGTLALLATAMIASGVMLVRVARRSED